MSISQHIGAALVAVTFVGTPVYWLTDREVPVEIIEARVLNPNVAIDQDLLVYYEVDRHRVCPTIAQRTVYDGAGVEIKYMPDIRAAFGPEGRDKSTFRLHIPPGASPGTARYRVVVSYFCNPMHRLFPLTVIRPVLYFTITEPKA